MRRQIVCFLIIFSEIIVANEIVYDYEASSGDGIILKPMRLVPGKSQGNSTTYAPFEYTTRKQVPLPEGPFFEFLVDICYALIAPKYAKDKIAPYFKILRKSLHGLGGDYLHKMWIARFCRRLKKYSVYNKNRLKMRVFKFLKFIADGKPHKNKYINSMNAIFTMKQILKMDDYVYELKRYGMSKTEHIGQKTRDVFENVVFGTFYKKPRKVRWQIDLCFKTAVLEYWEDKLNSTSINSTTLAP